MTIDIKKQFQKFIDFGLTERETKVYMVLLTKKCFTTSELQNSVDITRTKIYEILQKMEARGICTVRSVGKVKYFEAVEPKLALQRVFDKYREECQSEYQKRKNLKEELIKVLNPVFDISKDVVSPLNFIEIMNDKNQIQKKYLMSVRETKNEMLTFNKGPYVCDTSKRLSEQIKEEKRLLKKGAISRNIYEEGELKNQNWLLNCLKSLSKSGNQVRIVKTLPVKMMVFDENRVILPLQQNSSEGNGITLLYIEHHGLALACKSLFNNLWEKSGTIKF
ncbi:MAG: helix-turn-helix domain-containing protein [Ignavibacteria bacterium]|jgi:sugar-specific transcriptional regulator TrmB